MTLFDAVTENASNTDVQNVTQVHAPHTLYSSLVPERNSSQQDSRKKRAILAGTDIVEIMVFADDAICSRFTDLENGDKDAAIVVMGSYYALLVNEVSLF
ncbi:hypothetical protein CHS0354_041065 [Potamilus streckersoni]|uniref:Uncharacterized protein n=1 Tax=Potamilus streckersoni TaxID=2493646 RepID=A0AAE0VTZ6_9BIVA|nr:hypothetical protein CHS0354_041065 [Potamilus streckersoni]